ncbi:Vacuolar fusion protein mon1 [Ceratocystis pirilliformis]|uniref:Vacuolar fusion protein MON1 n=1 Tax=Ceratocystis pirilliformis TaxID=259994 RepID=A0ABR3YR80_9PEZI
MNSTSAPASSSKGKSKRPSISSSSSASSTSCARLPANPSTRPESHLRPKPTTAVSSIDIQTLSFPDGSRGTFSTMRSSGAVTPIEGSRSGTTSPVMTSVTPKGVSDFDDSASVASYAPTHKPAGDIASLMVGDFNRKSPAWNLLRSQSSSVQPFETVNLDDNNALAGFGTEFDEVPELNPESFGDNSSDEFRMKLWKSKLKHYMVLSSAGKPVYSRHGDLSLVNGFMGVVQTIISFYEGSKNPLQGFTAGDARFVISIQGPLYFVAISRLGESDSQLRAQLEALYMQILSTLTLPALINIFANRPSTDLRKPLQGTGPLLSSLADNFTRGSPSALLGSLECLKIRKSHRLAINNTFLKMRSDKLLYGLIVAGGRLVSVIRPRRHSLHPSDLHLIFNMLFQSGGVRAGEGENWIPLCLPAFNNKGYLYMYVSFFDGDSDGARDPLASSPTPLQPTTPPTAEEEIAIILISPDRESFFELQTMRNDVIDQLSRNGSLAIVKEATRAGRPTVANIAPACQISHFLYKSKPNVQFTMASLIPAFAEPLTRRRLMTTYHQLHMAVHAKHAHMKVFHAVSSEATALAWITSTFEFYCVAGPNISRAAITQSANKLIQWVAREKERLFIIGGGVF